MAAHQSNAQPATCWHKVSHLRDRLCTNCRCVRRAAQTRACRIQSHRQSTPLRDLCYRAVDIGACRTGEMRRTFAGPSIRRERLAKSEVMCIFSIAVPKASTVLGALQGAAVGRVVLLSVGCQVVEQE